MPYNKLTEKTAPASVKNDEPFTVKVGLPAEDENPPMLHVIRLTRYVEGLRLVPHPVEGPAEVRSDNGSFVFERLVFRGAEPGNWTLRFSLLDDDDKWVHHIDVVIWVDA